MHCGSAGGEAAHRDRPEVVPTSFPPKGEGGALQPFRPLSMSNCPLFKWPDRLQVSAALYGLHFPSNQVPIDGSLMRRGPCASLRAT